MIKLHYNVYLRVDWLHHVCCHWLAAGCHIDTNCINQLPVSTPAPAPGPGAMVTHYYHTAVPMQPLLTILTRAGRVD